MESYSRTSHTVYKALERPALYFGLPLPLFFMVCAVPFLLGMYISSIIWVSIPVIVFLLGLLAKKDSQIFHILYLKFKTLGNRKANLYYGANAIFAQQYESVPMFTLINRQNDEAQ